MRLVALGGRLRAGKDAVGDYLAREHGFVKVGMSDALAEALYVLNPLVVTDYPERVGRFRTTTTWEPIRYRDLVDAVGYADAKKHEEVRRLLQVLGTDVGRDMISKDVWTTIMRRKILDLLGEGKSVVVTAIRFENELELVRDMHAATVWIDREESLRLSEPLKESWLGEGTNDEEEDGTEAHRAAESIILSHASESGLDKESFGYWIHNNGTLEELYENVEWLLFTRVGKRKS